MADDIFDSFSTATVRKEVNAGVKALDELLGKVTHLNNSNLNKLEGALNKLSKTGNIDVDVSVGSALAQVKKLKQEVDAIGRSRSKASIEIKTSSLAAIKAEIQSLVTFINGLKISGNFADVPKLLTNGGKLSKEALVRDAAAEIIAADIMISKSLKERSANRVKSASKMNLDETRMLLGMPDRNDMKSFAAQIKSQMQEALSTEKLKVRSASKMNLDETRMLLGMPDRNEMKSFAAQIKSQMQEALSTDKLKVRSASKMNLDETRMLLGMPDRNEMKSFAAQIKSQMQEALALDTTRQKAAKIGIDPKTVFGDFTDIRSQVANAARLATQLEKLKTFEDSAKSLGIDMAKVVVPPNTHKQLVDLGAELASATNRAKALEQAIKQVGKVSDQGQLAAAVQRQGRWEGIASRRGVDLQNLIVPASSPQNIATHGKELADVLARTQALKSAIAELNTEKRAGMGASHGLSSAFKRLTLDGNDVHSMARGLASGFNLLWLTWGNMIPLLAGTAISMGFTRSIKAGAEFADSLFVIGEVAGTASANLAEMSNTAIEMGKHSSHSAIEVAKGMEILSLAGLKSEEVQATIKSTMAFANVGGIRMEEAAATSVAVSTAYGYVAKDFAVVQDIIAKTAADTQSSITNMSEAFRQASVVAQQYGVSLSDTSFALGALAQIGITGSAAGTAFRNMITELYSNIPRARNALKELGVDLEDGVGKTKDLITVYEEINAKLILKTPKARKDFEQDMTNNRAQKSSAAILALITKQMRELNPLVDEQAKALEAQGKAAEAAAIKLELNAKAADLVRQSIRIRDEDAAGFNHLKNIEKELTPSELSKGIGASLSTQLTKAFEAAEPQLTLLALRIREIVNSKDFLNTVQTIVTGTASAVSGLVALAEAAASGIKTVMGAFEGAEVVEKLKVAIVGLGFVVAAYVARAELAVIGMAALRAGVLAVALTAPALVTALTSAAAAISTTALVVQASIPPLALLAGGIIALTATLVGLKELYDWWNASPNDRTSEIEAQKAIIEGHESEIDAITRKQRLYDESLASKQEELAASLQVEREKAKQYEYVEGLEKSALENIKKGRGDLAKGQREEALKIREELANAKLNEVRIEESAAANRLKALANVRLAALEASREIALINVEMKALELNRDAEPIKAITNQRFDRQAAAINASTEAQLRDLKARTDAYKVMMREQAKLATENAARATKPMTGVDPKGPQKDNAFKPRVFKPRVFKERLDQEKLQTSNLIQELDKRHASELSRIKAQADAEKAIIDAKHSAGLISAGAYAAQAYEIQERSDKNQLDQITKNSQEFKEAYEARKSEIEATMARSVAKNPKMVEEAKAPFETELKKLDETRRTHAEKVENEIEKIVTESNKRKELSLIALQGQYLKVQKESEKFWREQNRETSKTRSDDALNEKFRFINESLFSADTQLKAYATTYVSELEKFAGHQEELKIKLQDATVASEEFFNKNKDGIESGEAAAANYYALLLELENQAKANLTQSELAAPLAAVERATLAATRAFNEQKAALTTGLADAVETGIFEGGDAGAAKLRDLLEQELLRKPFRVFLQGVMEPISGPLVGGGGTVGSSQTAGTDFSKLLSNGISSGFEKSFAKFATSETGSKLGLSYYDGTQNVTTGFADKIGPAMGTIGDTLAGYAMGSMARSLISGGYSAGKGMDTFQKVGIAVGSAIGGPMIGATIGAGAGVFNRAFGRKFNGSGIEATFGGKEGFTGRSYEDYKGGWFRSDKTNYGELGTPVQNLLTSAFRAVQLQTGGFAQSLGLTADKIADFTTTVKIKTDGLDEAGVIEAINEGIKKGADELAQQVLGSFETVTERVVTRTQDAGESVETITSVEKLVYVQSEFARAGETASETLNRLGSSLLTANKYAKLLSDTTYEGTLKGADAASTLADAFGGVEQFQTDMQNFYSVVASPMEQTIAGYTEFRSAIDSLGVEIPNSAVGMKLLANSMDLTTEAGRQAYATLIKVGPQYLAAGEALLQSFGTSTEELAGILVDGLRNSDPAGAGQYFADTIVYGIENALYQNMGAQITQIVTNGIIAPLMQSMLLGETAAVAISKLSIASVTQQVQDVTTFFSALFNNSEWITLMDTMKTGLAGVVGGAIGGMPAPRFEAPVSPWEKSKDAADDAEKAAEEAAKHWEDLVKTVTERIDSAKVQKIYLTQGEAAGIAAERATELATATKGLTSEQTVQLTNLYKTTYAIEDFNKGFENFISKMDSAGGSASDLASIIIQGLENSDPTGAGQYFADTVLYSIKHAMYSTFADQIVTIITDSLLRPLLTGASLAELVANGSVNSMVENAKRVSNLFKELMTNADIQAMLSNVSTLIAGTVSSSMVGIPALPKAPKNPWDKAKEAADKAKEAADKAKDAWESLLKTLTDRKLDADIQNIYLTQGKAAGIAAERAREYTKMIESLTVTHETAATETSAATVTVIEATEAQRAEVRTRLAAIYSLEDYNKALEGEKALKQEAKNLQVQLLKALGKEEQALAKERDIAIQDMERLEIEQYDLNKSTERLIEQVNNLKSAFDAAWDSLATPEQKRSKGYTDVLKDINKEPGFRMTFEEAIGMSDASLLSFVGTVSQMSDISGKTRTNIINLVTDLAALNREAREAGWAIEDMLKDAVSLVLTPDRRLTGEYSSIVTDLSRAGLYSGNITEMANTIEGMDTQTLIAGIVELYNTIPMSEDQRKTFITAAGGLVKLKQAAEEFYRSIETEKLTADVSLLRALGKESEAANLERQLFADGLSDLTETQKAAKLAAYDYGKVIEKQIKIIEQREALENELYNLLGNTAKLREKELAALDPTNHALRQHIWAIEDSRTATDKALAAAERAIEAERKTLDKALSTANESVSKIKSVFDILKSEVARLYQEVDSTVKMGLQQGLQFVDTALFEALSTGKLPEQEALQDALSGIQAGMEATTYTTQFEADRDRLVLAGKLASLKEVSGKQLTEAEQLVINSEKALDDYEDMLKQYRDQIDTMRGIDVSVISVKDAIVNLQAAIVNERSALNAVKPYAPTPTGGSVSSPSGASGGGSSPSGPAPDYYSPTTFSAATGLAQGTASSADYLANSAYTPYGTTWDGGPSTVNFQGNTVETHGLDINVLTGSTGGAGRLGNVDALFGAAQNLGITSADIANMYSQMDWGITQDQILERAAEQGIPAFAAGGSYQGGLALVGEEGPELINFDKPGQVYTASQTKQALGNDNAELVAEIRALREENKAQAGAIVRLQSQLLKFISRWDGDGMPETREVTA